MENNYVPSTKSMISKGVGFGLFLMLIGVIFLGLNFGLIPGKMRWIIFSWQMLLIFIGVINLFKKEFISGLVLISIGGFFIVPKLVRAFPECFSYLPEDFTGIYWPVLLIVAGVLIIAGVICGKAFGKKCSNFENYKHYHSKTTLGSGFSRSSIFGAGEHIVLDPEFTGGEMNAIFGGITLDLRKTNLPVGETKLEVNAVFGGVTLLVPETWLVETHLDTVFGGFEDKRKFTGAVDTDRKLLVVGACVFGGGEIKN